MKFLACLPLIAADIPAVLSLDRRCLGGLWTNSGYQKELESDCSDLLVLVGSDQMEKIEQRRALRFDSSGQTAVATTDLAATDPTEAEGPGLCLIGVGCLWAILEEAHITTLAIEPAEQGQKLGQLLLCQLLGAGRLRGLTRATLEVRASNQRALGLYEKFEFRAAGTRKRYYADGEDALILWRSGLEGEAMQAQIRQQQDRAIAHLSETYQQVFLAQDIHEETD